MTRGVSSANIEEPRSLLIDRQPIPLPNHVIVPYPFPLEIWYHIIDLLRSDGRSHTRMTAISRSLRSIALPFYFQSIALQGRLQMERFLAAYEYSLPEECRVRDLLLTGNTSIEKGTPEPPKWERSLRNVPFYILYHHILQLLSSSLEHLTVTYPLKDIGSIIPTISCPHLHTFTTQAAAFNHSYDLPFMPSLRRMYLFGSSLDHDSLDILFQIAPELEELRFTQLSEETLQTYHMKHILGMDKDAYKPSQRRLLQWEEFAGQSRRVSTEDQLEYLNPPVLPRLQVIHIDQPPSASLEEIIGQYSGPVRIESSPLQDHDTVVLRDWEDVVLGGQGSWATTT
jgi:hypothetical protein